MHAARPPPCAALLLRTCVQSDSRIGMRGEGGGGIHRHYSPVNKPGDPLPAAVRGGGRGSDVPGKQKTIALTSKQRDLSRRRALR